MKYFRTSLVVLTILVAIGGVWVFVRHKSGAMQDSLLRQEKTEMPAPTSPLIEKASDTASSRALPATDTDSSDIRLLFGGDMMFDRYIRETGEKKGYNFVFAKMRDALMSYDRVIANLEGPITSQPSVSVGSEFGSAKNYVFTFDPKAAQALADNNIRTVNIGNNHILNFGEAGLAETRGFLAHAGIGFFGDPKDASHRSLIENIKGTRIAFVNYNQFVNGGDETQVIEDIRLAKQSADVVIVYTHWGIEYSAVPQRGKDLARRMVDAGADAVIGSHPHVVQESETYRGKRIYYSLGNFVFDQFFRDDTKRGLMVEMIVHSKDKSLSFDDRHVILSTSGQVGFEK